MNTVEKYLKAMKVEHPEEYNKMLKGYESEEHLVSSANALAQKAVQFYKDTEKREKSV